MWEREGCFFPGGLHQGELEAGECYLEGYSGKTAPASQVDQTSLRVVDPEGGCQGVDKVSDYDFPS